MKELYLHIVGLIMFSLVWKEESSLNDLVHKILHKLNDNQTFNKTMNLIYHLKWVLLMRSHIFYRQNTGASWRFRWKNNKWHCSECHKKHTPRATRWTNPFQCWWAGVLKGSKRTSSTREREKEREKENVKAKVKVKIRTKTRMEKSKC